VEVLLGVDFGSEVERRLRFVDLIVEGLSVAEAAARLGRSRQWGNKWLDRYRVGGEEGLVDRSRRPKRQPTKTPLRVVSAVLRVRKQLEEDPVASIGALSIVATLEREGFTPIPSVATIERILSRAGVSGHKPGSQVDAVKLPLPVIAGPGKWHQADWIHDRYLEGGIRFQSLQISDVGSHGMASGQFLDRKLLTAVEFLVEDAWRKLSIPQAISTDNSFAKTTHRDNPFTLWVRACLYFGAEVIIGPPGRHGWTNHIEAVNNLWQERTIRSQHFSNLDELRAGSERACEWLNTKRPILDPVIHGTRYPAEYIDLHRDRLRWPPPISIADHLDPTNTLTIPLSHGRVTFLRHVTTKHTIEIAHRHYPIPKRVPAGGLVTATITTTDHNLTIRHQGEATATFPYPIPKPLTNPYHPPAETSLLQHV
jgi:transposase